MEGTGTQPPSGEGVDINQIAQDAYDGAQSDGLGPQESFDAAANAIREAGAEAGFPPEEVEAGISAANEAYQSSMEEGGDPTAAFNSAMEAGEAAAGDMPPPDGEMGDMPPPDGEMAGGDGTWTEGEGDMPPPDDGVGDMLDSAMSTEGSEPAPDAGSEPTGADLALEQAVCETETDGGQTDPGTDYGDMDMPADGMAEGDFQPDEGAEQPVDSVEA
jgi:hypothetical protein